jgi:hypothetical protein
MPSLFRQLILIGGLCLLSACGGTSGDSTAPGGSGGGTVDPTGIWGGTYSIGGSSGSTGVLAVIQQGGAAFFYDQNGVVYVLPEFSGSTNLSGTLTAIAPAGITLSNGESTETFMLTATVSASSITGTFTNNSETGTFTLTPLNVFSGNPAIVPGNWQGFYVGSGSAAVDLTVQQAGTFVGNDANGCNLSGTLTPVTGQDLFTASVDSTGGASCAGQLSGLAFESNQDLSGLFGGTTGTYYYVGVSNAKGAFVAELKVQ